MEEKIIEAYQEMLISGEEQINAFTLSKKVDISEQEFYQYFTTTDDIGRKIWANIGNEVIKKLSDSESFHNYSAREKVLTYYFTFFEVALGQRIFIEASISQAKLLKTYKENFKQFIGDIVQEGIANDEIKERLTLSNYYPDVLWELHVKLINFWLEDTSENFIETDKAIEIYSKLPLELMGHNVFDSFLETVRFGFDRFRDNKFDLDRVMNRIQIPERFKIFNR